MCALIPLYALIPCGKVQSKGKHSRCRTYGNAIGKPFVYGFLFLLLLFLPHNLPEIRNRLIRQFSGIFHAGILIMVDHIVLHGFILFIINVKTIKFFQCAIVVSVKSFFLLTGFHPEQYLVVSSEMIQMDFQNSFVIFLHITGQAQEPSQDVLIPEIFFYRVTDFFPDLLIEFQAVGAHLHAGNLQRSPEKEIGGSVCPVILPQQDRSLS